MFHAINIVWIYSFIVCKNGAQGDPVITHKKFLQDFI